MCCTHICIYLGYIRFMMVSARMLEPVDYLDISSVVLLFVVLCYTLLPAFVPVYCFNTGVATQSYSRTRWGQQSKGISELAFEMCCKPSSQNICRGSIPCTCLPLGYKQQGSEAFSIRPPRYTPYGFCMLGTCHHDLLQQFARPSSILAPCSLVHSRGPSLERGAIYHRGGEFCSTSWFESWLEARWNSPHVPHNGGETPSFGANIFESPFLAQGEHIVRGDWCTGVP